LIADLLNIKTYVSSLSVDQRDTIEDELFEIMRLQGHVGENGELKSDWAKSPSEWVGEFFQSYLQKPEETKRAAPTFAGLVRKLWNENEQLSRILIFS
jgi:hypothetical protein